MTPPLPRALQVEVTGACNLRCPMCLVRYRPTLDRATASLSFAAFREMVDAVPDVEEITLQGLGEPLMAPDLFRIIEHAAARGIRVGFNTNATLLTRATSARLVDAGLDWLCVSLDGATPETYEGIPEDVSEEDATTVNTATFVEEDGRTTLTILVQAPSQATRDAIVESGMEDGLQDALDLLEGIAQSLR